MSSDPSDTDAADAVARTRRPPSSGFPIVPLPDAAKIIREAGKYGFEHSVSAFARYMGHSSTNSGAFRRRLAAFRDWKLIAGRGDTIVFTDTAKTIALPASSQAEQSALATAFMNCAIFAALYDSVAKGQPVHAQGLGAKAVHELGVSPSAVDRFTASFVESAVAAGLADVENGEIILRDPDSGLARDSVAAGDEADDGDVPAERPRLGAGPTHRSPPILHQEWRIGTGIVLFEIRLDHPLPATVFARIGDVVTAVEALAERLHSLVDDETDD